MRHLISVPMLHSPAILSNMAKETRMFGSSRYGRTFPSSLASVGDSSFPITTFWKIVQKSLREIDFQGKRPRIFIEGYTGRTLQVSAGEAHRFLPVRDTPEAQAIGELINTRGAIIETTESGRLLRKGQAIYRRFSDIQQHLGISGEQNIQTVAEEVLSAFDAPMRDFSRNIGRRDTFIAKRIAKTLQPNEIGILFLGAAHEATLQVPSDIRVTPLSRELTRLLSEAHIGPETHSMYRARR